nr:PHP domain-containing protein [Synechococcus elongatus PCC 11802]
MQRLSLVCAMNKSQALHSTNSLTREPFMLELHTHTTYSDGSLSPTELVEAAIAAGVTALAITDHDTLGGWTEAIAAAGDRLEIVPGIELSTIHNDRSLHLLGFWPDREVLEPLLIEQQAGRWRRAEAIAAKLAELGAPIVLPELQAGQMPGRPHFAQALLDAGHVQSWDEAFRRFLGEQAPAYVPYEKLDVVEGIRWLREAGAVVVWAHPFLWRGGRVEEALPLLVEAGLQGLEVIHPGHSPSDRRQLEEWCDRYQLLPSGGSDYHGPGNGGGRHAESLNTQAVPTDWLEPLRNAAD